MIDRVIKCDPYHSRCRSTALTEGYDDSKAFWDRGPQTLNVLGRQYLLDLVGPQSFLIHIQKLFLPHFCLCFLQKYLKNK